MSRIVILDTDILIDAGRDIPEAVKYLEDIGKRASLAISVITQMESMVGCRDKKELEAVEALRSAFSVERVILFGSKARGESDLHSDIDLLIVTSQQLHWKEEKQIVEMLFDIGMEYDVIFSTLFATKEEWEGGIFTRFPIYQENVKDGAIVI